MSTSLLYHAFGYRNYLYKSTEYRDGEIIFEVVPHKKLLRCPHCKSRDMIRKGKGKRWIQTVPIGGKRVWRQTYPKAVQCLERDLDHLLFYLNCQPEHHKATRTSNHIERQFKEYRHRMKPMEIIPTQDAADRIVFALTMIRNEKLREYPLSKFTHNLLH